LAAASVTIEPVLQPNVGDTRSDPLGFAEQFRERGPILHVGRGHDSGDEDAARINQHVSFHSVNFFGTVESAWSGHRRRLNRG
jgi:hypothetical protein